MGYKPDREKTARAHAVSTALIEGGRCHFELGRLGGRLCRGEESFPNGSHDDDVDATTQGLLYIREKFGTEMVFDEDADIVENHNYQQSVNDMTGY